MKKKQFINEIMGVPKILTPWVNSFYQIIMDAINEETKNGWEYEGEIEFMDPETKEVDLIEAKKTDEIFVPGNEVMDSLMEINGYSDMKQFLKSEMFKGLPLWRPSITIVAKGLPNEVYEKEKADSVDAAIGSELSQGLSKIGSIPVFPNITFIFNALMPFDEESEKFKNNLKTSISHELLHAYQKIKQLEGGIGSDFGKESMLNALANHPELSNIELDNWKRFLHLVYLHLSFEINARVTQLYYSLKEMGVDTKEKFLKEIKDTSVWREMQMLKNFNADEFIKNFKLPGTELEFGTDNPIDMLHKMLSGQFQKMALKNRGLDVSSEENTLKSIINLWDVLLKTGGQHIKKETGIDFNMLPVPESAKKDPYLFFKFFEKRFHKKANKWERKLYRIASLLTQNDD